MGVNISNRPLPEQYRRPPPGAPGSILPTEEFIAELRSELGEFEFPFDPQKVPFGPPSFYQYHFTGSHFAVAASLWFDRPGAKPLGLHYYKYEITREEGHDIPVENHFFDPGDVGSLVNVAGVAILKTTRHAEQADAFTRFLLDVEAQEYFAKETAEYPVADGVKPYYDDLPPLDQVHGPDIDLNDLDDLEGTLEMLTDLGLL